MTDVLSKIQRSNVMRAIKCRNTAFEIAFRSQLWRAGLRFRLNTQLPGRPDIVFPSARLGVFLDSCFWHGCSRHCRMPKTNTAYWHRKIGKNRRRDRIVTAEYRKLGWRIIRLWEHTMHSDPETCVLKIKNAVLASWSSCSLCQPRSA
jgi:DNA mismatch endonuclease (patch repair protein)